MGVTALRLFARGWLFKPTEAPPAVPDRRTRALPGGDPTAASDRRVRVVVTGAGGPAGFAVCRDLINSGHQVIALDADPLSAGLRLEGVLPFVCRRADDEGFGEEILQMAGRERAEALISTVTEELSVLIPLSDRLSEIGCQTWFPSTSAVEHCLDKSLFAVTMRDYGIAHPPTAKNVHMSRYVPGPFVVKPRYGRGSRGVAYIDQRRAMRQALRRDPSLIVQSRLVGQEWTADVLVDRSGVLVTCVPRWRVEVRGGISTKGVTFTSEDVTRLCAQALEAVGLTGIANVQGVVDPDGRVAIIEINPRFSGGLPLSLAARADLVGAYLGGILEPQRHLNRMYFVPGTVMVRHFEEMFEGPTATEEQEREGELLS
jgi:carbamoyl-phosphate synthase large subunit